jgi:ABC-2 type transport system permease protein
MFKMHRVNAFLYRHWLELRASIDRKADVFFFPVIDILVFGFLATYISSNEGTKGVAAAILGGIIFWTLVYNIQRDIPFSLLDDAWSRNIFNFYASPIKLSEILVGTLILSVIKALISTFVIVVLAAGLFKFNLFAMGPVLAFYVINIFLFGWTFGFFTSGIVLRFGTKAQAVSWSLVLLIYPFSGALYPLSVLPPWMETAAKLLPLSYIFEGVRGFFFSGSTLPTSSAIAIITLNLVYLALGVTYYINGHKAAKNRGWYVNPT